VTAGGAVIGGKGSVGREHNGREKTLSMGVGMVAVLDPTAADRVARSARSMCFAVDVFRRW
jgi:phosphoribosylaminoimidazole (AIR) synthetase